MSRYSRGQRVIAIKDIHRFWSGGTVHKGSQGIVIGDDLTTGATVEFVVKDFWGERKMVVEVDDDEIELEW